MVKAATKKGKNDEEDEEDEEKVKKTKKRVKIPVLVLAHYRLRTEILKDKKKYLQPEHIEKVMKNLKGRHQKKEFFDMYKEYFKSKRFIIKQVSYLYLILFF